MEILTDKIMVTTAVIKMESIGGIKMVILMVKTKVILMETRMV